MRISSVVLGLIALALSISCASAQAVPYATWIVDISKQPEAQEKRNIQSVIFTDNEHVAAVGANWLTALQIDGIRIVRTGEWADSATFEKVYPFTAPLQRVRDGHILVYRQELTFPQLKSVRQVDLPNVKISRDGSLVGVQNSSTGLLKDTGTWCVSLYPTRSPCIVSGNGRLLALGRQGTIAQASTSVHITNPNGKSLGEVKMGKVCVSRAEFVSNTEFLLNDCKQTRLIALHGTVHRKLPALSPLSQVQPSDDGARLLISRPSRHVSPFKRLEEDTVAMLTLGVGVEDETNNRTLFTVIATASGHQCFQTQIGFNEPSSFPSADLSPDGRKVVIGFGDQVRLFHVPDTCQ